MLQFMENGPAVFEGADIAKNLFEDFAGIEGVLSHPVCLMSIGTNGNDFSAQFLKASKDILRGKETAAAVHAAGIQLHAFSLLCQNFQNLVDNFLMFCIGYDPGCGVGMG